MLRIVAGAGMLCLLASTALADGGVKVALPEVADLTKADAVTLLEDLVRANVATSNCQGYGITDGEWSLITGTADLLAASLGIGTDGYDEVYYKPAFADIDADQAGFCDAYGPTARGLIDRLVTMGGTTTAAQAGDPGADPGESGKTGKDKL